MSRCRFVQPDIVRLPLSDGDWIDVKKQLNAGEQRRIFGRLVKAMHIGEKTEVDPEQVGKTKLIEYIVGWSFVNAAGGPEPFSEDALENLDVDTFGEIVKAVDDHEETQERKRLDAKNGQGDASKSSATSPSVV